MINVTVDGDGVATLVWDQVGRSHNLLTSESVERLREAFEACLADEAVRGLVVTSAKVSFIQGADLEELCELGGAAQAAGYAQAVQEFLRGVERGGKPVVAALNGSALGGGFEFALACHRRISIDTPGTLFGLPEVQLGLLPGGGGTQRLPRLIGPANALSYLLNGTLASPRKALADGLIDEICEPEQLLARARTWILSGPEPRQPWDLPTFTPRIDPKTASGTSFFLEEAGKLRAARWFDDEARTAILACVYESTVSDVDVGLTVERRRFAQLMGSRATRNIIRTTFHQPRVSRRQWVAAKAPEGSVAVLGAGMMGAGIAAVCAAADYEVVLLDRDPEAARRGREHAMSSLRRGIDTGEVDPAKVQRWIEHLRCTTDYHDIAGARLVVEAVFEERGAKAEVYHRAAEVVSKDTILASNTSTLPIGSLAASSDRPARFIGLHFFSPVERMSLVEVICGVETSEATLALALGFVRRIGKTPIVVNDSRGFFTSRVFSTYVHEGLALLGNGVGAALIDNASRLGGMPVGPLTVVDEISARLLHEVRRQTAVDLGEAHRPAAGEAIVADLVEVHDRPGRRFGRGIYDYPSGGPKRLWTGLADCFEPAACQPSATEVTRRLLYIQALEAARCLEEGVVASPGDADLGSVLGWNFPAMRGGVLTLIDEVGSARFVEECHALADTVGARFAPPDLLCDMARRQARFHPE